MGVRSPESDQTPQLYSGAALEPSWVTTVGVVVVVMVLLLSNGRPIASGDTRVNARVAASLVTEGDFDLDELTDVEPPFVREVDGRRLSIYPTLGPLLAAPVFALARLVFPLDETGCAVAGKLAASLFSALAAGALFVAVARRRSERDGIVVAVVFALGTSVWSTSQDLWQHPAAVLGIAVALLFLSRADDDPRWADRAGLPLGIALAVRHADVALVAVLAVATITTWPRRAHWLAAWSLPPMLFVAAYNTLHFGAPWHQGFGDASARFDAPWGVGHAGLLISPAKGLFVFTPVVLVGLIGLARAAWRPARFLASAAAAAAIVHWAFVGRWGEWHGGESWGPRMMTDALPALLLFLPEGLDLTRAGGMVLAVVSCAIQALGAFSYDLRWERVHQRAEADAPAALWRIDDSPIVFHVVERVVILAAPALNEGKVVIRRHPVVIGGPVGSRLRFSAGAPQVEGSPATFSDAHLQSAAHVDGDVAVLRGHWAGIFLRLQETSRVGPLVLTVEGRGSKTLYVGERSFWAPATKWSTYPIAGAFRIEHRYFYPQSGGGDLLVTVGRGGGEAEIRSVALAAPPRR